MQEVRGSSPRVTTRLLQRGAAPATAAGAALRKRALGRRDHMLRPFGAEVRRGRRDGGVDHRKAGRKRARTAGSSTSALAEETTMASATREPSWTWKAKPERQSVT